MAIERERGISISSTAMSFPYRGRLLNLLDTPGHADFSEDTYRTLSAADNALMLVDAGARRASAGEARGAPLTLPAACRQGPGAADA